MCAVAAIPWIIGGMMAVGTMVEMKNQNKQMQRQANALAVQNNVAQQEIADQHGQQINERMRAARRERAAARVAASESGINLGSNSFLAMLQTSEINQSIDSGLILHNESTQQRARNAQYQSNLAGLTKNTGLGIAVGGASAFAQGYFGAGGNPYFGKAPGRG